jgi:hypothetical protein
VVPSRESNSGLPYSKPTRYQLSHAARFTFAKCLKMFNGKPTRYQLSHAARFTFAKCLKMFNVECSAVQWIGIK